jgi:uncharacterized protein
MTIYGLKPSFDDQEYSGELNSMLESHVEKIARELDVKPRQVRAVADLFQEGATIPFISRYRKEATGGLDENEITIVRDRLSQLEELEARRKSILNSLEERDLLTDELRSEISAAQTMARLEDIYLPHRPKRRTRAAIAREKGLGPLADLILAQEIPEPEKEALAFLNEDNGIDSPHAALAGARDIIAESVNEDPEARARIRDIFSSRARIRSKVNKGKETEGAKFSDYFDSVEPVESAPAHRVQAMFRGEREGILSIRIRPPEDMAISALKRLFIKGDSKASQQLSMAVEDSYKRLMAPSLENEIRNIIKQRADQESIEVFVSNLRELLLAPPLGQVRVMALDPGFRTGAKLVCLDEQGKLLRHTTIFPTQSKDQLKKAKDTLIELVDKYGIEAIAVGNGTGGRETEAFIRSLPLPGSIRIMMVDESGASVYSASQIARREFPDHDVTVRGAVSIGRRLMDPLAELVKIDPKAIGVGQYQHDVDQAALKRSLDDTVMSCVNLVGVDINTASPQLLAYVSGLGPTLATNIVKHRDENGPYRSRKDILKAPRLGPKAFEQSAGFLRIPGAANPLDASAAHPESYHVVERMALDSDCSVADLMRDPEKRRSLDLSRYVTDRIGLPTLKDILQELEKPGRDPRKAFEEFSFKEGVESIDDLAPGMRLPGIVTNVTNFGAFVDVGAHQDGLVHISQLADRFVKDPSEVVKVRQKVFVTVIEIDRPRNRIGLSMLEKPIVKGR